MNTQIQQLERERLLELAEEYSQKGYEVLLQPKPEDLPEFLRSYHPNMIVRRGEEAVVIEVKSRPSIASAQDLQGLAQVVQEHPGWRVELVMTNRKDAQYFAEVEGSLEEHEIKSQLQVARELTVHHPESAILYAWSLAEATLRLLVNQEGLCLPRLEPLYLLKQLATEGVISQPDYQLLMNTFRLRNAIAHGFKTSQLTPSSVFDLIEVTEQLLNSLNPTESFL